MDTPGIESLTYSEKILLLKEYYKKNLLAFGQQVMGFNVLTSTHKRWEKFVLENIDLGMAGKRGQQFFLIEAPRETYKSTFFTTTFIPWALTVNPNLATLITSATQANAKLWMGAIKKRVESERFRTIFGDWEDQNGWRETDITIRGRTQVKPEPSISCAGLDTTITSKHFDLIIADDLVTPEDRDSTAKRLRTIRYWDDIIDLLNKDHGICFLVGTPWCFGDLYDYLEKKNLEFAKEGKMIKVLKEPVYVDRPDGRREYLFPDILPEERVKEIRLKKTDIANFSANYLLKPIHPETQIFKPESIQYFNYYRDFPKEIERIFVHIDPSQGDKKGSDYCAMVAVARRKDGKRLVIDTRIEQMRPTRREEVTFELFSYFKNSGIEQKWQIETVANQAEIKRSLIKYFLDKGIADFPLKDLPSVANKTAKIITLELPISNGSLLFRDDWQTAPGNYHLLLNQLFGFPLEHDDGPDALKEAFDLSEQAYKMPNIASF